jgi:hypothetical protein
MPFVIPRRLMAAGSLLLLAACQDETISPPREAPIINVPAGAVQAVIQQESATEDGLVTFAVRVLSNDLTVSSFQGTVTFAPGSFELVSNETRPGTGMTAVLNTNKFAEGRITFAALTPTKFDSISAGGGIEAFRFTVRPLKAVSEANLVATLDVVGTDLGAAIGADKMLSSRGVLGGGRLTK